MYLEPLCYLDGDLNIFPFLITALMTYCFAFAAPPDGIAIISDTRISTGTKNFDDQQKVFFPDEHSFVAISGTVGKLVTLLENISPTISTCPVENRIDFLAHELRSRYGGMFDSGHLTVEDVESHGMSIIYGDVRFKRDTTRTRLVKFDFTLRNGVPAINVRNAERFGWLAIGLTPVLRQFISNTAADRLDELENRGLVIREKPYKKNPFPGKIPYMVMDDRSKSKLKDAPLSFQLDSSGEHDGTYRASLRRFYSEQKRQGNVFPILEPINQFGIAAMQRIAGLVEELKRPSNPVPGIHLVSDTWCLATISRDRTNLYTYKDIDAALESFSDQIRGIVI